MIVKKSKFQKIWAAQPIRFPVEKQGRFEPITVEQWTENFVIPAVSIDDGGAKPKSAADGEEK